MATNKKEIFTSYSITLEAGTEDIIKLSGTVNSIVVEADFIEGTGRALIQSSISDNELLEDIIDGLVPDTAKWKDWDLGIITEASPDDLLASTTPPNALKFLNESLSAEQVTFNYKGSI